MSFFNRLTDSGRDDALLRRVVKNSGYLFSSSTLSVGLGALTSVFTARALDAPGLGIFGAITAFAAAADKLLSFRIGELVIKYAGQALAQGQKERAAAVFKVAALTELTVSLLSYLLILFTAPWAAVWFAGDVRLAPLFVFYGLIIPAGFIYESASALLQVGGRFRSQAALNLAQSIVTAAIVFYAFLSGAGLQTILAAYLAGKTITGLGFAVLAFWRARGMFGPGWWRVSFHHLPEQREFWKFAFSSNFSNSVNLFVRDSEVLWVNYFLSPTEGGYYKLALTIINLAMLPVDPFIKTSFPEISKAVAEKAWERLKSLLRRLTAISAAITFSIALVLLIAGRPITLIFGPQYTPALAPALILLIGYGTANIFFWNRPLLLSLGHPTFPLVVMTGAGLLKIGLGIWLVPQYGYLVQAGLMAAYLTVSVSVIVWRGLTEITHQSETSTRKS